jgi:hypothetical protein
MCGFDHDGGATQDTQPGQDTQDSQDSQDGNGQMRRHSASRTFVGRLYGLFR